ncbi:hypothetical protein O1611_g9968 [Lasiodiplodia mahajangana]|uniref:Uncharacterized protein n=1 Tax=Lasiodiplodia mahajangana TaxID=1108764 RepID=A0ACC2J3Q3_9PEZI|nr:hypothetical protein O1611_g9968 [Lasiodiplodia mahajangana]
MDQLNGPVIDIIRVADYGNDVEYDDLVRDPGLTLNGIAQSRRIGAFLHMNNARLILSSPLRRAIQTAGHALAPMIQDGVPIHLIPTLQAPDGQVFNTGSPWQELREEFGSAINVDLLHNGWYALCLDDIREQARQVRVAIRQIASQFGDNDRIVVVTHGPLIEELIHGSPHLNNAGIACCRFLNYHDYQATLVDISGDLDDSPDATPPNGLINDYWGINFN